MIGRLPSVFAAVYLLGMLLLGGAAGATREGHATLQAFAEEFGEEIRLQRFFLFPVGFATSIVIILALFGHMNVRSSRGRLQLFALAAMFGSAGLWEAVGDPLADAIVAAASGGAQAEVERLLGRWDVYRWTAFGIGVAITGSLVAAERMPLVMASGGAFSGLTPQHRTLLFLLGTATLFEGYDRFIASLALPYIGDDLGAREGVLGWALSAIRLGALLSIVFGRLADRHGRRKMLLFTILAYTLTTAATGFSRGIVEFVLFQLLATVFLVTELSLAQVVITEEFPASFRARGQGFLGAFAALGAGMAALLFPIFQETALGWRGLYFVGVLPLLLIAWLRRAMPETRRWHAAHSAGETERFRLADLLAPEWRLRFLVLLAVATAATTAIGPAFAFASYRATKVFAWTPSQVSAMILLGGGTGIAGWFVFGWLAERLGRRPVGVVGTVGASLAVVAFYQTPWLFPAFALLVFMEAGAQISLNAFGTELFPTAMRSTAKTWITNAWIIGAMIGLAVVGLLSEPLGGVEGVVTALALAPLTTCPLLLLLPESRGLELEELTAVS